LMCVSGFRNRTLRSAPTGNSLQSSHVGWFAWSRGHHLASLACDTRRVGLCDRADREGRRHPGRSARDSPIRGHSARVVRRPSVPTAPSLLGRDIVDPAHGVTRSSRTQPVSRQPCLNHDGTRHDEHHASGPPVRALTPLDEQPRPLAGMAGRIGNPTLRRLTDGGGAVPPLPQGNSGSLAIAAAHPDRVTYYRTCVRLTGTDSLVITGGRGYVP
jgi:hypothetical protein